MSSFPEHIMGIPQSVADDRAAFLEGCVNKKRSVKDAYENLGLFSQTLDARKDPDLQPPEANELFAAVKKTARLFASLRRGNPVQLQTDLALDETLSDEVETLAAKHGPKIWTPTKRPNDADWLDWENLEHRETIQFYVRCWMICSALKGINITPQKAKGKGRAEDQSGQITEPVLIHDSDGSDCAAIPHRAPTAPMFPRPRTMGKRSQITTPSKRKFPVDLGGSCLERLEKLTKSPRKENLPVRRPKDVSAMPKSPSSATSTLTRNIFGEPLTRGYTQDSDRTWQPSAETASTDIESDADDISQLEIFRMFEDDKARNEQGHGDRDRSVTAGPSGTYRFPHRQDSVIPGNCLPDNGVLNVPEEIPLQSTVDAPSPQRNNQDTHMPNIPSPIPQPPTPSPILQPALILIPPPTPGATERFELFKLLISYLNNLNQFSLSSPTSPTAESRMDFLLTHFLDTSRLTLAAQLETWPRIDAALQKWLTLRRSVDDFRRATGYFGEPGAEWEEYLAGMENVPCAQATLAYVGLQEKGMELELGPGVRGMNGVGGGIEKDEFHEDVMTGLNALTGVKRVGGREAFRGVRQFNVGLLRWFEEDEVE